MTYISYSKPLKKLPITKPSLSFKFKLYIFLFALVTFNVLNNHKWQVAIIWDSTVSIFLDNAIKH